MIKNPIKIILRAEDNPGDARLLREMSNALGSHNSPLFPVQRMDAAQRHLAKHPVDLIPLDLGLPDAEGLAALRRAHAATPRAPMVVLEVIGTASTSRRRHPKLCPMRTPTSMGAGDDKLIVAKQNCAKQTSQIKRRYLACYAPVSFRQ